MADSGNTMFISEAMAMQEHVHMQCSPPGMSARL